MCVIMTDHKGSIFYSFCVVGGGTFCGRVHVHKKVLEIMLFFCVLFTWLKMHASA